MTARAQGILLQLVYSERRTSSASASPFPPALSVPCRASAARTRPEPCLFFPRRNVRIVCARTRGLPYSRRAHEPVLLILLGSAGFLVSVACLAGAVMCRSCAWDGCADAARAKALGDPTLRRVRRHPRSIRTSSMAWQTVRANPALSRMRARTRALHVQASAAHA